MRLTFTAWETGVLARFPKAQFTLEDGSGKTYGEAGDWAAHTGPDMQADIVGGFHGRDDYAWISVGAGPHDEFGTETHTEDELDAVLQEWSDAPTNDKVTDLRVQRHLAEGKVIEPSSVGKCTLRMHTDEGNRYCVVEEPSGEVQSIGLSEKA